MTEPEVQKTDVQNPMTKIQKPTQKKRKAREVDGDGLGLKERFVKAPKKMEFGGVDAFEFDTKMRNLMGAQLTEHERQALGKTSNVLNLLEKNPRPLKMPMSRISLNQQIRSHARGRQQLNSGRS